MKIILLRSYLVILTAGLLYSCSSSENKSADTGPRKIEMMFLGHAGEHHNSGAFMPLLASGLSQSGINITYTESVEDLNPQTLALYDGLIIYANHEEITTAQEEALLDFVAEGNAFIPIHSASFCFLNSPEYIELVGGQFQRHDTGTFTAEIVKPDHPAMQSVEEFSTWDETYFHDKMTDDRTVLMERVEGEHREPWTWVKEHGKGKVFYTAYGHDERTWSNPEFHKLIKRGILWAVNDDVKKQWEAYIKDIPNLVYKEVPGIPNYEKRDPAPRYQEPLSPEESKKLIHVPAGFKLELFASEPDIINPIDMAWDERGRLWVIETVDYPNTVREDNGVGDDRIKICEDTDGDGKADKFTVFADKLNIPTSLVFANGGLIVSQAPHFLFLKDTNGDDKADVREVLINGWGTFDTHAGPSNLQYGIDNQIYGVVGYSGFEGNIGGETRKFKQGMYRFTPDVSSFEFLTSTSNNTWGFGLTENNDLFASTANNTHSVFMGIPDKILQNVEGIPKNGSTKIDGHYGMQPITSKVRQVDVFGGFTAAAGHSFYTARSFPKSYWNKVAFVSEPTGHLVHLARIEKDGAGFKEHNGGNLFASADEWVSPVAAKVGPDGAVWVLDWYNFIIQHNPTPSENRGGYDAENGPGNAYENPLRDKSHGRIWRVVYTDAPDYEPLTLSKENPDELVEALQHDNLFWRLTAQRLLVERGEKDILPALYKLVKNGKQDELGINPGALHALWTIHGLGVVPSDKQATAIVLDALNHRAAGVRKAAIQALPKAQWVDQALKKAAVLNDKDESVQLAALLYFAERTPSESIGKKLFALSQQENVKEDEWLLKGVYAAASKHSEGFIAAYMDKNPDYNSEVRKVASKEELDLDVSNWSSMDIPQFIEQAGLEIDGIIWFRKTFDVSGNDLAKNALVSLGPIDDSDVVYINGIKVGGIESNHEEDRIYKIPSGILKSGKNAIAIRVEDNGGGGGIYGKPEQMFVESGGKKINLSGAWKYEVEEVFGNSSKSIFEETPMAEVFVKTYSGKTVIPETVIAEDSGAEALVINIKTLKNEMKYDLTEFTVKAGQKIEIVFENPDFMQHNLLIVAQGAMETVGKAADKLASDPTGAEKNYIPDVPEVLFFTPLVNPEETVTLTFVAPNEPGNYPYICTFPGHWRIMNGVMKVMKRDDPI